MMARSWGAFRSVCLTATVALDRPLIEEALRAKTNLDGIFGPLRVCDSPIQAAAFQVDHADDHRPGRIEGQILKAPALVEAAGVVVERMCKDTKAADIARRPKSGSQGEEQQR